MKNLFFLPKRLVLAALLGMAGALATACQPTIDYTVPDYSATDEALIQKFVADNKITNAQRQGSGLYFVPDSVNASAVRATAGDSVYVLYTGQLLDGTVFDATSKRNNRPFRFKLGRGTVIPGWEEGVALMHKGDRARLLIPSALAYGPYGSYPAIAPNTVIRFDLKVTQVKK